MEGKTLEWTEKPMKRNNKWEASVAKQIPLPKTISPTADMDLTGSMEQLKTLLKMRQMLKTSVNDLLMTKDLPDLPEDSRQSFRI